MSAAVSNPDSGLNSTVRSDAVATRLRIVAAAERLFAERGIDGVSLQQINRAAGQRNRSAVQYHFGNKEGVIHAILDKHTAGIERRRHELLDEIEASGKLELRRLAEALVIPLAEKLDDPDGGIAFLRVNAHLIGHPDFPLLELHAQRVNRGADRLHRLTARACPDLPMELWMSRWLALSGLLFHGMADYAHLTERNGGAALNIPRSVFVSNMVDCAVAVMEVPQSPETDAELERSRRPDEETPHV